RAFSFFFSSRSRHTRFSRDWRSDVCSSDLAVVAERRPQLAQRLQGGTGAGLFVLDDAQRFTLALGYLHRGDLVGKSAGLLRGDCLLLGGQGKGILLLATDLVALRQVLGGDAHVVLVEDVPEAVMDRAVYQLALTHALSGARAGNQMRAQAHGLLAAGNHHPRFAAADRLRSLLPRLDARAADLDACQCRY